MVIDKYFQWLGQGYILRLEPIGYYYFESNNYKRSANNLEGLLDTVIKDLGLWAI